MNRRKKVNQILKKRAKKGVNAPVKRVKSAYVSKAQRVENAVKDAERPVLDENDNTE